METLPVPVSGDGTCRRSGPLQVVQQVCAVVRSQRPGQHDDEVRLLDGSELDGVEFDDLAAVEANSVGVTLEAFDSMPRPQGAELCAGVGECGDEFSSPGRVGMGAGLGSKPCDHRGGALLPVEHPRPQRGARELGPERVLDVAECQWFTVDSHEGPVERDDVERAVDDVGRCRCPVVDELDEAGIGALPGRVETGREMAGESAKVAVTLGIELQGACDGVHHIQ